MAKGFDCATKLNKVSAKALKKLGFEYVARYLGNSWKSFDKAEAAAIQDAGLKLISIHQKSANYSAYFTEAQGISDAKEAMKNAAAVDQPKGTAIYFAVDFSSQAKDVKNIVKYFKAVKKTLSGYKLGVYGSYNTITAVKGIADYYWQTYAWSGGKVADFIHIHQFKNDVLAGGIKIDHNDVKKAPGHWAEEKVVSAPKTEVAAATTKKPSKRTKNSDGTYTVVSGDTLGEIAADFKVTVDNLVKWNKIKDKNLIEVGQKLKLAVPTSSTKKVTIKKGDTLSGLAKKYSTTVSKLKSLNGLNSDLIISGKSLIVPAAGSSTASSKPSPKIHVVKKGETVTSIAKKEKTTVVAIKKLNPSRKNFDLIYPGDKIRIK